MYQALLIYGTAYTPYYYDDDETIVFNAGEQRITELRPDTTLYTYKEMTPQFAQKLIGLPVWLEHEARLECGQVIHAHINDSYQVKVILMITVPEAIDLLYSRLLLGQNDTTQVTFNALSLGNSVIHQRIKDYYQVGSITMDKEYLEPSDPVEISICRDCDRPFSLIDFFIPVPYEVTSILDYARRNFWPEFIEKEEEKEAQLLISTLGESVPGPAAISLLNCNDFKAFADCFVPITQTIPSLQSQTTFY